MSFLVLLFCFVGNYVEYELLWVVVERLEDDLATHAATLVVR